MDNFKNIAIFLLTRSNFNRPPTDRSSCPLASANRSTSSCPPVDRSSSTSRPTERTFRSVRASAYRSTSTCLPADHSSFTYPPVSSTFTRNDRLSTTYSRADWSLSTCTQADRNDRSTYSRSPADWWVSTCLPTDRSNSVCHPTPVHTRWGLILRGGTYSRYQDNAASSAQYKTHSESGMKANSCN